MTLLQAAPTYRDGLHLPGTPVWLDPIRPQSISFVSHIQHIAPRFYPKALSSIETAELVRARSPHERKFHPLTLPYGQFFSLGNLSLELIPSGMGMGGAQLKIASNGYTTLYSRNIATQAGMHSTSAMPTKADRLILGTDGACAEKDFISRGDAGQLITQFLLENGNTEEGIMIRLDEVGDAQELSSLLHEAGIEHGIDERISRVNNALMGMGMAIKTTPKKTEVNPGEVVLVSRQNVRWTTSNRGTVIHLNAENGNTWRDEHGERTLRYSSLASADQLISFVEAIEPGEILTIGTNRDLVANELESRGWHARPSRYDQQLPLSI